MVYFDVMAILSKMITQKHIFFIGILLCFGIFGFIVMRPVNGAVYGDIMLGESVYQVEVVRTVEDKTQGLSGRKKLAPYTGMLFEYDYDGRFGVWMKDMLFPIDILWINQELIIVHIEENVFPDSYPRSYSPSTDARYFLEVNAGVVKKEKILLGDEIKIIY